MGGQAGHGLRSTFDCLPVQLQGPAGRHRHGDVEISETEAGQGGLGGGGALTFETQRPAGSVRSRLGFLDWSRLWASSSALRDLGELLAESWP